METRRQMEELARLRFLDQSSAELLDEAMLRVTDQGLLGELDRLRADHERHALEIDALFGDCGEVMPVVVSDPLKARMEARLGEMRAAPDQDSALRLLLAAEESERDEYGLADRFDLPGDEGPVVHAHLADEQRHVEALERLLGARD